MDEQAIDKALEQTHAVHTGPLNSTEPPKYDREKHFLDFKTKVAFKSKNEILRLCFDACEAITFLEARVKELETSQTPAVAETPPKEKRSWLGLKKS